MTCIVGIEQDGDIWIGGDSAGSDGYDINIRSDEKVFVNDEMLYGFTYSFRMGQLLRYAFVPPEHSARKDDMTYLVGEWTDAVRNMYREKGFLKRENEEESGGCFLLGYRGHLYVIYDDFQVGKNSEGYAAVGSGGNVALGSLYTTQSLNMDPEQRITLALEAATQHNSAVRGPFTIQCLKKATL